MTYFTNTEQASKGFNRNVIDELVVAQAELYNYIEAQAQAVAPEEFTSIEIDFYHHEIYANGQLIAQITYDHQDFVTQRWLVMVNNKEEFRANAWGKCYRYICTHHKDGSLNNSQLPSRNSQLNPIPESQESGSLINQALHHISNCELRTANCELLETPAATTGNEIMVQIFDECENLGLELLDDGIYRNDEKLGEVGQTNGNWWFTRTSDANQQRILCDSVSDAVWYVSRSELPECTALDEYLQYRSLEQMPSGELKELLDSAEFVAA